MSEEQENGALCFWLGFFLSLFGVLIAAIIGKGRGVVRAFQGMLFNALIVITFVIGAVIFGVHGSAVLKTNQRAEAQATEQTKLEDLARQQRTANVLRQEESERIARDEERHKRIVEIESEKHSLAEEYRAVKRIADGLTGLRVDNPTRIDAASKAESLFKKGSSLTEETKALKDNMGK
jgi:hypothetical protein